MLTSQVASLFMYWLTITDKATITNCVCLDKQRVGWLCLTSHRQRGHLETVPSLKLLSLAKEVKLNFYSVPTVNRTLGRHAAVTYTTAVPRQLPKRDK